MLRERVTSNLKSKTTKAGWVLPRASSSFADADAWTNIDCDVTPIDRRTWSAWTMFGYWFSDALNAQSWMAPASIIAIGLTWLVFMIHSVPSKEQTSVLTQNSRREAIVCIIFGSLVCTVPLVLNGMVGARLHIPFPVAMRASFGWYFSRFAVVTRAITALFWHAIQTYTGSTAMTQIIRSIWPSYLDIPNHIPESVGITTQGMVSHLIFWSVQFPILLIPPHKLKWFFVAKCVLVVTSSVAMVITMTSKAGGSGEIWTLPYGVHGSERSWLILSSLSSITGGWATMATNIPDFTRYLKTEKGVYWQVLFLPGIQLMLGLFGIICCSASKVVYGKYIWDPLEIAAQWDGPAGRCGAFWIGLSWVVAQIGTNLSANVISCANDICCLFPKYINIKRGVILSTITAAWIMQPWKIIHSAQSLLAFMAGLGIFLAPIAALLSADYWVVHRQKYDVPGLYRAHGRYRYNKAGTNWRAVVAFLVSVVPSLPGMAATVDPKLVASVGDANKLYYMFYFWGYTSAFVVYTLLSHFFPAPETHIPATIFDDSDVISGEADKDSDAPDVADEKLSGKVDASPV